MIEEWVNRKTLVPCEAVKLDHENVTGVSDWCGGLEVVEHDAVDLSRNYVGINVRTREGNKRASEGDYVVRNWSGFEVWKPIKFQMEHFKKG